MAAPRRLCIDDEADTPILFAETLPVQLERLDDALSAAGLDDEPPPRSPGRRNRPAGAAQGNAPALSRPRMAGALAC